ncbi:hypothetical protein QR685DRAFT_567515 [Neurospora intermedia]|uniref:Nitrogen regulatory protein areA GATA-like domain-containing protein n=1 Tax=Neurospora intermedia TaxID=5142 RepID=A0ABR3DPJ6_NEUIN
MTVSQHKRSCSSGEPGHSLRKSDRSHKPRDPAGTCPVSSANVRTLLTSSNIISNSSINSHNHAQRTNTLRGSPKMKQPPIEELVYGYMFPKARPSDPPNFSVFLQRHLIYEVRQEVHSYYGHIDTQEAKYPGLDYNHPIHRIRLSRWTWHRRLFRAFDALRLTEWEIANLTKWEGTRWAKEKYEEEQGIIIRDTTADGFPDLTYPRDRVRIEPESSSEPCREAASEAVKEDEDEIMNEDGDEAMSDEGEIDSALTVPPAFSGHQSIVSNNVLAAPSDEEWLKIAIETGQLPHHSDTTDSELSAPRILAAAREGRWHDVPTIYRDVLQSRMGTHFGPLFGNPQLRTRHFQYGTTAEPARRTTSELRLATASNFSQRVARPGA